MLVFFLFLSRANLRGIENSDGHSLFFQLVISHLPVPRTTTVILLLNQCARLLLPLLPVVG